ncbi:MAG: ribonuclease P protein component [Phycisphaeraceae bacterium]|nr:ribonuclease P protein component [Phycisphaeraceae bacterium]
MVSPCRGLLSSTSVPEAPLHFRQRHRLSHAREFAAAFNAKVRKSRGPLLVFTLPNDLGHSRLGLSVGTRVGNAVARNRVKRLIREAFRLEQHALVIDGRGYDIVATVRPAARGDGSARPRQPLMPLASLRRVLVDLVREADTEWRRRERRDAAAGSEAQP